MKRNAKKIKQWVVLTVLFMFGFASFLVLLSEDAATEAPTPTGKFIAVKVGALAVLCLCVLVGKYLNRKGLLPEVEE